MRDRIIVAVFPNTTAAYNASSALKSLSDDKAIDLKVKTGALFSKDARGNIIPLEEKERPLWGTLAGGVAGALIGLLAGPAGAAAGAAVGAAGGLGADALGSIADTDFVYSVAKSVNPGDTAVVVEVKEGSTLPVDGVVSNFEGRVYRSNA